MQTRVDGGLRGWDGAVGTPHTSCSPRTSIPRRSPARAVRISPSGREKIEGLSVNQGSEKEQVGSIQTRRCDALEMLWFGFRF